MQYDQYAQNNDILRFIIDSGMINISDVQNSMEAMKRKELLEKHPYKIWQGKDEKWYTYLPDDKKGRPLKKRTSQKAIEDDVFDGNTFKVRRTETRFLGENGRYVYDVKEFPKSEAGIRTVIIPKDYEWLCTRIKMLNPFGEYIFTDKNGKRLTTNCIRRRQEKNCVKLGIYKKSPHKIRKTYGSILLDHNVDNRMIMEQMGHTDISCTENHYHRNRRSIDAKSQILSNIPEPQAR